MRLKVIAAAIVALIVALVVTDRVVRNVWSRRVFKTYYALKEKHTSMVETAPDRVVVRDDGSVILVFEPPLLFWSAHLNQQAVLQSTYGIEIGHDRSKNNEIRIRMLQELD
jgi:uncharacterized membrane protein